MTLRKAKHVDIIELVDETNSNLNGSLNRILNKL